MWLSPAKETPIVLAATCDVRPLYGSEGEGFGALVVSTTKADVFSAFVYQNEVVFSTISKSHSDTDIQELRSLASNLVLKQQLGEIAKDNIFKILQDPYDATLKQAVDRGIEEIYLPLAMPWLKASQRKEVASRLNRLGLSELFPNPKDAYMAIVVSLSLGAGIPHDAFATLLTISGNDESLLDIFQRINGYAEEVWGSGLIHITEDEIAGILI